MLVEIGIALLCIVPVMIIGKYAAAAIKENTLLIASVQTAVGASMGYNVASVAGLSTGVLVLSLAIAPTILHLISYADTKWQNKQILSGKRGEEVKWAAELAKERDEEFIHAANNLSQMHLREVGIIAESKEELRELTIERFEEQSDDEIPSEFA